MPGITSIAVLTGYNDAAQLSRVKPDIIVPDLLVLRTLMRRYALPSDTQDSHQHPRPGTGHLHRRAG